MKNRVNVSCLFGIAAIIVGSGCGKNNPQSGDKEYAPTNYSDATSFMDAIIASDMGNDVAINYDLPYELPLAANIIDECPNGICSFSNATCITSAEPEFTGYKSICSFRCWIDPQTNTEYVFYLLDGTQQQTLEGTCATLFANGANCCGNATDVGEEGFHYYCVPSEGCCPEPLPIRCGANCCSMEQKCNQETKICELKCQPPAPMYCENECCPNNYSCECVDQGGFCLPEGAEMCDCEDQTWCEPLQECVGVEECHADGKICKPLGAEDCLESDECYCNPGLICTHESPACCPSDTPVPCGNYCCPEGNECLPEINNCLPPGWTYCEKWGTKCGVGEDCMENEPGCKDNEAEECNYGNIICLATENCVGEGKGVNGCCPTNQEVPCDGYCCPKGTHCEAGCGGCVIDNYFCCPDGVTTCFDYGNGNKQICWNGGNGVCLDSPDQDCGSYWCDPNYVCSSGPQKCCAASTPQTCGSQCCLAYETCYEADSGGFCVDEQGGEEYCGDSFKCGSTQDCCVHKIGGIGVIFAVCMPAYGVCCGGGYPWPEDKVKFCGPNLKCCNGGCSPSGTKCCGGANEYCPIGTSCCGGGLIFSGPPGCYPSEGYYCCSFGDNNGYCPKDKKWCVSGSATGNKLKCCPKVYPNVDGCIDPYSLSPVQKYP